MHFQLKHNHKLEPVCCGKASFLQGDPLVEVFLRESRLVRGMAIRIKPPFLMPRASVNPTHHVLQHLARGGIDQQRSFLVLEPEVRSAAWFTLNPKPRI